MDSQSKKTIVIQGGFLQQRDIPWHFKGEKGPNTI
jgi:hypothetical protein